MEKEKLFFNKLVEIIHESTGLDCKQYNELYIKRRINSRILANNLKQHDYFGYIKLLENSLYEIRELFNALTINVTKFFRDITFWETLKKDVIQRMIKEKTDNKNKSIYLWSCGCSSGEEAYSIAILLREALKDTQIRARIIATDIDEVSLKKAEAGIYDSHSLCDVSNDYILKYFHNINAKDKQLYEIDKSLRPMITFQRHNFLSENPPGDNFDAIFCRNVIIYFKPNVKDGVINLFHSSLVHHGWLMVGKAEMLFIKHLKEKFYLYNDIERIYRRERRVVPRGIKHPERRQNWWFGYDVGSNKKN
ncbi:MAG: protein-glutamate O-methyltransferase CheR [Endomicrobiales bacterium]|nr:protein-glutamate O-methyltransferase CheR [Endomicrobiales bacterium]